MTESKTQYPPLSEQDIVEKLLNRAQIRRSIPRAQPGSPDRISDLCEEAAAEIQSLREKLLAKTIVQETPPENIVRYAVHRLGGVTKTAKLLGLTNAAIHKWISTGAVHKLDNATALSNLTGIPVEKLRPYTPTTKREKNEVLPGPTENDLGNRDESIQYKNKPEL